MASPYRTDLLPASPNLSPWQRQAFRAHRGPPSHHTPGPNRLLSWRAPVNGEVPALQEEDDVEEDEDLAEAEALANARMDMMGGADANGHGGGEEDGDANMESAVVLHEDKKYYPTAEEVFGAGTETLVMEEDAQPLEVGGCTRVGLDMRNGSACMHAWGVVLRSGVGFAASVQARRVSMHAWGGPAERCWYRRPPLLCCLAAC